MLTLKQKFQRITLLTIRGLFKLAKFYKKLFSSKKAKTIGLAILLVIIIIPIYFFFSGKNTEASWWDEKWAFRKSIQLTNSGSVQTNVYVSLTVDTSDTTKFQVDCGDLRFTKNDGKIMPYLIASGCGTNSTSVYVSFDSFPAGEQVIWQYYGNTSAENGFAQTQTGAVTQANMRLSIVNGTAFVDFSTANVLTNNLNSKLVIADSVSKKLIGYIKAAGVGETLGSELAPNTSFSDTSSVSTWQCSVESVAGGQSGNALRNTIDSDKINSGPYEAYLVSSGMLIKGSVYYKAGTASGGIFALRELSGWIWTSHLNEWCTDVNWTQHTVYGTTINTSGGVILGADGAGLQTDYWDSLSIKQVTSPSPTGATITSTQNGLAFDWASEESGFNRNDSSNYTYTIFPSAFSTEASSYSVGTLGTEEKSPAPVGYWSFDEGQGTTVHDETVNHNDGNLGVGSSAPIWKPESECVSGKCLGFDGVNDFAEVADTGTVLDFNSTSQYTFSSWIKYSGSVTSTRCFFSKDGPIASKTTGYNLCLNQTGSTADVVVCKGNIDKTLDCSSGLGLSIPANEWDHIAIIYDGTSNWGVYKNGKSKGMINFAVTSDITYKYYIGAGNSVVSVGIQYPAYFFNGSIDEPKIYPYARTADQIKQDYNAGLASQSAPQGASAAFGSDSTKWMTDGLVGYWKMDETSGTTATDASGNGRNGTLYNAQETGTAQAGSTTTSITDPANTNLSALDNIYIGMLLTITNGAMADMQRVITGYNSTTKTLSFLALPSDPTGATFQIVHQNGAKFNSGMGFDGFNDMVTFPHSTSFEYAGGNMTISTWFKRNSNDTDNSYLFTQPLDGNSGDYNYYLAIYDNALAFELMGSTYYSLWGNVSVIPDQWHQVTVVMQDDTTITMYLDGAVIGSGKCSITDWSWPSNLNLSFVMGAIYPYGVWSGNSAYSFQGQMDEMRIYNRALSPAEVQKLYNWAPGPVSWWKLDEASGLLAKDNGSVGNAGTLTNMDPETDWVTGKYGKALNFDGNNDDLVLNSTISLGNRGWTVSAWAKTTSGGSILSNNDEGPVTNDLLIAGGKAAYYNYHDGSWYYNYGTTTINDGNWHYLSWVNNNQRMNLYVDGKLESGGGFDSIVDNGGVYGGPVNSIGRDWHSYFRGSIDDVKYYNYARTQEQIAEDMSGQKDALFDGLGRPIINFNFNEGYGTVAHNEGYGGVSMDGALSSSPIWTNDGKFRKALDFNGSGKRVTINNPFGQTGRMTATLWYKRSESDSSGTWRDLLADKTANIHQLILDSSTRNLGIWDGSFKNFGYIPPNDGQYHHYAVIYSSGSSAILYVDGIYQSQVATTLNLSINPIGSIGNWASGNYYSGYIDEVKIYNYALTEDDIKTDYSSGASAQWGSSGTVASTGAPSNSASGVYCVPGSTEACAAPVGEWNFNEKVKGDAKTLYDTSGNGNNGTTNDGANNSGMDCTQPGKIGSACTFDGVDDYVSATVSDGNLGTTLTFSQWVYGNDFNNQGGVISNFSDDGYDGGIKLYVTSSGAYEVGFRKSPGSFTACTTNTVTSKKRWYYLVVTYNAGALNIYVNGILDKTCSGDTTITNVPSYHIGYNNDNTAYFNGIIDQTRIYDYVRTPAQIAWEYNQGKPVAEWRFNECQGSTVHDESGNGNNGTINLGASGQTAVGTCSASANTPWYNGRTGKYGASLNFDGADDYAELTSSQSLARNSFSVSAWFKTSVSADSKIYSLASTIHPLQTYNGKLRICINGCTAGSTNVRDDIWHHAVVVGDDVSIRAYLDGNMNPEITQSTLTTTMTGIPRIGSVGKGSGSESPAFFFSGQIDDVKIFNYALTAEQVKQLYNNSSALNFGN